MGSAETYDVVLIGNGVISYSIAYQLSKRAGGLRIAVCGPASRSGAASTAAGAMLNTFGEITRNTLASPAGRSKFEVCLRALDRWPSWLAELKEDASDPELDRTLTHGTTVVLNSRSTVLDDRNFAALRSALAEFDEPYEEVDPSDVAGLTPHPEARPLRALHIPREGAIDARAVLRGLESAASANGVTAVDAAVTEIVVQDGRAIGARLADGTTLHGGTVILAAGAFSGVLLDGLFAPGSVPLMYAGRGISFLAQRSGDRLFEHVVRTPTRSGNCGLHMVPLGDGREYYGATNVINDAPGSLADLGMSEHLLKIARDQLDQRLYFADIEWKVGNRPVAVDGFPLIGRTSVDGLVVVTGTYRDGFHCSPILAQMVADDVLDDVSVGKELPLFAPERAPIENLTPEQTVEDVITTAVAASHEFGVVLPGWHIGLEPFEAHYRQAMDRFNAALDRPAAVPADVLTTSIWEQDLGASRLVRYLNAANSFYGN